MINEIAFVGTPVRDIARARGFYEGVLGLKATLEGAGGKWIEYDIKGATFAIGDYGDQWPTSADGTMVAFEVDDIHAEVKRLEEHGVKVHMAVMETPVCHFGIVLDPDGNKVMIHKRKALDA
ncbi:MAG: VOC family protein [Verrucomicrobiota bacterium]|nr:VOC family protein [Verrucomicrobiota bacterium]